jgi:hypothetical protein
MDGLECHIACELIKNEDTIIVINGILISIGNKMNAMGVIMNKHHREMAK